MENKAIKKQDLDRDKIINYLKMTIGNKLKPEYIDYFLNYAIKCNLNPFKREVYPIVYQNKQNGEESLQVLTGYEVYLKRAEETGLIEYWTFESNKDENNRLYAVCEVKRVDRTKPLVVKLYFDEYDTGMSTWKSKPRTMIEKCAISSAFRKSFPLEVGELPYTIEEFWKKQKEVEQILEQKPEQPQLIEHRTNHEEEKPKSVEQVLNEVK